REPRPRRGRARPLADGEAILIEDRCAHQKKTGSSGSGATAGSPSLTRATGPGLMRRTVTVRIMAKTIPGATTTPPGTARLDYRAGLSRRYSGAQRTPTYGGVPKSPRSVDMAESTTKTPPSKD